MPQLLHMDSSADQHNSRSRAITRTFADAWRSVSAEHTVVYRDLHADPPPHLEDWSLHWPARLRPAGAAGHPEAEAVQNTFISELIAADVVLIGAPLYNYSVPSTLKAWIDHIHVPGVTAPFDQPTQPMKDRPAVIVTTRGAVYDPGTPTENWDHAVPALTLILGNSLGMQVSVIEVNLTLADFAPMLADQRDRAAAELAAAHEKAAEAGRTLGQLVAPRA